MVTGLVIVADGKGRAGFVDELPDPRRELYRGGGSSLVCQVSLSTCMRESARTDEKIREVIINDVAAAASLALDLDAGIGVRDHFVAMVAGIEIDEWMSLKRLAVERGLLMPSGKE